MPARLSTGSDRPGYVSRAPVHPDLGPLHGALHHSIGVIGIPLPLYKEGEELLPGEQFPKQEHRGGFVEGFVVVAALG